MMRSLTVLVALLAAGCASKPAPTAQLARSNAAVQAAEARGADQVPIAREHLALSKRALADARRLMNEGDHERAHFTLLRAEADAMAAVSVAHAATARAEAVRALEEVKRERARIAELGGGPRS